jgi:hypothetical protein
MTVVTCLVSNLANKRANPKLVLDAPRDGSANRCSVGRYSCRHGLGSGFSALLHNRGRESNQKDYGGTATVRAYRLTLA